MNWFKQMVINWVREDWENAREDQPVQYNTMSKGSLGIAVSKQSIDSDPTLHFKVYNAIGGKIVEFSRYDRRQDRHDHQTYIITQDQDFGERIAKIATFTGTLTKIRSALGAAPLARPTTAWRA
jgi:hypothetical protein